MNGDDGDDIITGAGPLTGPQVRAFDGLTGESLESFFASPPASTRGAFVAGVSRRTTEPSPSSLPSSGFGGSILTADSFQPIDDLFSHMLVFDDLESL